MQPKPEYIIRIENKINQLIDRHAQLKKEYESLNKEAKSKDDLISTLQKRVSELEVNLETEKGKEKQIKGAAKPELEKKINDYIKEIDRCIALLGEQD